MKGHVTLKERGAVDDLKCILRGISQDLTEKLKAVARPRPSRTRTWPCATWSIC
jgi:hypothetical protein